MSALEFKRCDSCVFVDAELCEGCERNKKVIEELRAALLEIKAALDYDLTRGRSPRER